ncbi:MAG: hypothetical protein WD118_05750 [Phycisphaeraceae bacterium]
MKFDGENDPPTEVLAAVAAYDRNIEMRDRLTVGELFDAIARPVDVDPEVTVQNLLAIAEIGMLLLCGAIRHEGMTESGLEEARRRAGPIVDVVLCE